MASNFRRRTGTLLLLAFVSAFLVVRAIPLSKNDSSRGDIDEDSSFFGLYNMFGGGNPKSTPDGQTLVEGDIVLPKDSDTSLMQRKAVPDSSLFWPNGEVVYTYHESINQNEMNVIEAAIQHWRKHTCLTFRQRQANDYIFVRFRSDTQGCWSLVGRQVDRMGQGQDVSIGQGCANLNVVVHEIGHVVGFFHEQSRSDRDQYINIVWENVLPGYGLQFRKENDANYGIPYDLISTMQYPQWAFSKEIFEKSTIVASNPAYQRFLSKNYPLSFRDRLLVNQMYQCTAPCGGLRGGQCQNGGYMRATSGSLYGQSQGGCSCDCPPNFTGSQCETPLRSDYYEELPCGGVITQEGKIETPGYPQRTAPGQSCMWDIRAPAGKRVRVKFDGFEFAPRFTKPGTKVINKCFNETVEIRMRNRNIYDGDMYCGTDIAPGTVMRSDGPRAVIIITANDKMWGKGLSATVKFIGNRPTGFGDDDVDEDKVEPATTTSVISTTPLPLVPFTTTQGEILTTQPPVVVTTQESEEATTAAIRTLPPIIPTMPPILPPQTLPPVGPEQTMPPVGPPQTLPPVLPPQPPTVVTISSLLEEYEKEAKKTLPPVGPFQ